MKDLLYRSILFQGRSKLLDGMTALRRQGARRLRKHGCPGGSNSGRCSKATKGEGRHCCCIVLGCFESGFQVMRGVKKEEKESVIEISDRRGGRREKSRR